VDNVGEKASPSPRTPALSCEDVVHRLWGKKSWPLWAIKAPDPAGSKIE